MTIQKRILACILCATVLLVAASTGNIRYSQIRSGDRQGTGVKIQMAGTIGGATGDLLCRDANGNTTTSSCATASVVHVINFGIDGGGAAISTGDIGFYPSFTHPYTTNKALIPADQSGSITVDVWKRAGAIPSSSDKISASAPITLSSSQLNQNSSRTGWTNSVS